MTQRIRFLSALGACLLGGAAPAAAPIDPVQTTYLMRCGGCHGIEGRSDSRVVPDLRGQVGWFLCTREGRDYLLRVPNVAMSLIPGDERLAAVMNFVTTAFAGGSRPAGVAPFTAAEIRGARREPLRSTDLATWRAVVLARAQAACRQSAPAKVPR